MSQLLFWHIAHTGDCNNVCRLAADRKLNFNNVTLFICIIVRNVTGALKTQDPKMKEQNIMPEAKNALLSRIFSPAFLILRFLFFHCFFDPAVIIQTDIL